MGVCVEYALEQNRKNSFSEVPLKMGDLVFAEKAPLAGHELVVLKKADTHATKFFHRMADSLKPVSYTHLTLPTIYSV